jgi:hypothetical protein
MANFVNCKCTLPGTRQWRALSEGVVKVLDASEHRSGVFPWNRLAVLQSLNAGKIWAWSAPSKPPAHPAIFHFNEPLGGDDVKLKQGVIRGVPGV